MGIDPQWKREAFIALKEAADNGKLVPPKRKSFSRKTRVAVLAQTDGNCADCGEPIVGWLFEVDHDLERDLMGANDLSNLRALHPACHKAKTSARAGDLAKVHRLHEATFSTDEPEPSRLKSRNEWPPKGSQKFRRPFPTRGNAR
jgi:hypothetical protein